MRIIVRPLSERNAIKLKVALDGPYYSRSHEVSGEEANMTQTFFYESLPEGRYEIRAQWDTNTGKQIHQRTEACFVGAEERCDAPL